MSINYTGRRKNKGVVRKVYTTFWLCKLTGGKGDENTSSLFPKKMKLTTVQQNRSIFYASTFIFLANRAGIFKQSVGG